jgi:hypothetical protein
LFLWRSTLTGQFVLLAIYGLCSGDKRSFEFTEAFHAHLVEVSGEHAQIEVGLIISSQYETTIDSAERLQQIPKHKKTTLGKNTVCGTQAIC